MTELAAKGFTIRRRVLGAAYVTRIKTARTSADTAFRGFDTIKPGRTVPGSAPHLKPWLVSRGNNIGSNTRLSFPDDGTADNPLLRLIAPLPGGRRCWPAGRHPASIGSTSTCKAPMKPYFRISE